MMTFSLGDLVSLTIHTVSGDIALYVHTTCTHMCTQTTHHTCTQSQHIHLQCTHMHTCTLTHAYMYLHTHTCTHMHTCTLTHIYMCTSLYMHIHVHMYTLTHAPTHTQKCLCTQSDSTMMHRSGLHTVTGSTPQPFHSPRVTYRATQCG